MSKRPKRNILTAYVRAGLIALVLLAPMFATATPARAATSQQEALSCEDGKTDDYSFRPAEFPDNPDKVDPKQLSVTVGQVSFWFDSMQHHDRSGGNDSWDFAFKPKDATDNLSFVFRQDPSSGGGFGYVVDGPPGDGLEPENKVCNLIDFHMSPIGEFLKDRAGAEGLKWAREGGISVDTQSTDLLDRAANDPFSQVVQKVAEVLTTLIGGVASAVAWAIDAGTLMNNEGLAKAWTVVRDLVDALFIVVLLALAMMSIIRVEPQKYNVRSLLPLMVFSVIAVNFSFLFANIIANTAAVLSQPFLAKANAFIHQAAGVGAGYSDGLVDGFGEAVVLLLASVIILIALLVLLFFLVARIIVVWVLAVLSPVVFLFLVLPLTRGEARNLLKNYIQWVYLAPIAMLLLFTGSLMLNSTLQGADTGDPGGSAILQALFFAGITIAAVMVPIGLGGRIAQVLSQHGSRLGKGGGKAGLGAAGMIPLGRGMTVGEAARTGRAFMKQRTEAQQERAALRAAGMSTDLYQALEGAGAAGIGRSLTGHDATQAQSFRERLIDKELKDMAAQGIDEGAMRRIVAHDMGKTRLDGQPLQLSATELDYANSRMGALAAVKGLSQQGWFDWDMLPKYANTGYHKNMAELDPLLASVKKSYRGGTLRESDFDQTELQIGVKNRDGDAMRKVMASSMEYARAGAPLRSIDSAGAGQTVWRRALSGSANATALGQNMNINHRNVAVESKRQAIATSYDQFSELQRLRVLQGIETGGPEGFIPLQGGPGSFSDVNPELIRLRTKLGL